MSHHLPTLIAAESAAIRNVATQPRTSALTVLATATAVRSAWLGIASAYRAPEADVIVAAMDRPHAEAAALLDLGRGLQEALLTYADHLQQVADLSVDTAAARDLAEVRRQGAERECAHAIAALRRPVTAAPPVPAGHLLPPQLAPPPHRWVHPEHASDHEWVETLSNQWLRLPPPQSSTVPDQHVYAMGMLSVATSAYTDWIVAVGAAHNDHAYARWVEINDMFGRTHTVVSGAKTAWTQWRANADYDTGERIGRTATQTAATAGGSWVGGVGGALGGGALGTAILPGVGTVVGATVGSAIGGYAGNEVGSWAGSQIEDIGGAAGAVAADGLGYVGDHMHATGDRLWDTMSFWD